MIDMCINGGPEGADRIEPTRELYDAYRRYFYAVQTKKADEALDAGHIPKERALASYGAFVMRIRWLQENDPDALRNRAEGWLRGFEADQRSIGEDLHEMIRIIFREDDGTQSSDAP
ncbi:MAG: hypothetical protein PHX93_01310 [Candidatus Peribacteraceae bacterium]|jgi:hypothetical protein|nr:hypothetical protein [Candidatus Peribacteraceae bacterium]